MHRGRPLCRPAEHPDPGGTRLEHGLATLVDGGLTDDIPGDLLPRDTGIPSVGVYLTGKPPHLHGGEPTLFALASFSVSDLLRGQEYLDRHAAPWVHFVAVDTGNLNMLDARVPRADRERLMELGRSGMERLLQDRAA